MESPAADEFLLAAVQALVAFTVVLTGERFAADGADEGALVGVRAEVGAEVVGAGEFLWAQGALEGGGVFLVAAFAGAIGGLMGSVGLGGVASFLGVFWMNGALVGTLFGAYGARMTVSRCFSYIFLYCGHWERTVWVLTHTTGRGHEQIRPRSLRLPLPPPPRRYCHSGPLSHFFRQCLMGSP